MADKNNKPTDENFLNGLDKEQQGIAFKIHDKAVEYGIDPDMALAMGWRENHFRATGRSSKDAVGPMQVRLSNAEGLGLNQKELLDVDKNIDAGMRILKENLDRFDNNPRAAIVAYNANPRVAQAYLKAKEDFAVLPKETQDYLEFVHKHKDLMGGNASPVAIAQADESNPFGATEPMPPHLNSTPAPYKAEGPGVTDTITDYGLGVLETPLEHPLDVLGGAASGIAQKRLMKTNEPNPIDVKEQEYRNRLQADPNFTGLQGNVKDSGQTGRAHQTVYQTRTSDIAQADKLKEWLRLGLINQQEYDKLLSEAGINASTPSGILTNDKALRDAVEAASKPKRTVSDIAADIKALPAKAPTLYNRMSVKNPMLSNMLSSMNAAYQQDLLEQRIKEGKPIGAAISGVNTALSRAAELPYLPPGVPLNALINRIKGVGGAGQLVGLPVELAYEKLTGDNPEKKSVVKDYIKNKKEEGHAKGGPVLPQPAIPLSLKHVYYHRLKRSRTKS